MLISALIRIARQVVQNVLSQLTQQFNILEDMVKAPMQQIVNNLTDPVWKGDGATKFKEEVASLFIPGVGQVGGHIMFMRNNLQRAVDVMDQADNQAQQLARRAGDVFQSIF